MSWLIPIVTIPLEYLLTGMPQTIISGYTEFVQIATVMISQLQGTGPITVEAEATLIFDAFRAVITESASH
jgi:hypothetical protein